MKYLLVMPKLLGEIDHFNIFPIGLAYVSASLKKAGFAVVTANLDYFEGDTCSALTSLIRDNAIDVVCTGGLSRDFQKIKQIVDVVRGMDSRLVMVVGGGIISSDPEPAMRALGADIGVIGEGEDTICELAHALDNGLDINHIDGLIIRSRGESFLTTLPRKEIQDISSIPLPDFDGFGYSQWVKTNGSGLILTDRSCPYRCTFCFHPTGEKYRQRSFDDIFDEIEYQIEHYHITCIGLSSELFATTRERVLAFCARIKKYELTWACALRVGDIDIEMLQIMKASGCVSIVLGLESMDDSILKSMRKGVTSAQIHKALELTYEANIMVEGGFIFGDLNETQATVDATLSYWREHIDRHYLNLTMISVLPGSFLYKSACDMGLIQDREQFLLDGCPLVNVSKLNTEEYLALNSLIAELRLHPHVPAKAFRIETIQTGGQCAIEFTCRKCHAKNKTNVMFWYGKEEKCPQCGLINSVDPFSIAQHNQSEFIPPMVREGKTVIWGAGGIYYKLVNTYEDLQDARYTLVDADSRLHGLTICKKLVNPPHVSIDKKTSNVIIAALSRRKEIYSIIQRDYPWIERAWVPSYQEHPGGLLTPILQAYEGEA